jgi:hypothetical protein
MELVNEAKMYGDDQYHEDVWDVTNLLLYRMLVTAKREQHGLSLINNVLGLGMWQPPTSGLLDESARYKSWSRRSQLKLIQAAWQYKSLSITGRV